jgi:CubicO group peptidase (beta-lactamase class C family)
MRAILTAAVLALAACGEPGTTSAAEPGVATPATTSTTGLDAATMRDVIARAETLPQLNALVVMRGGELLVAQRINNGAPLQQPVNIKSASKSVLSALVGIAIERGVLDGVEQPVLSVLGAEAPVDPDPRLAQLTVGHLLSMRAGLERTSGPNYGAWVSSPSWVRYALSRPFVDEPGGQMLYSTGSTHLLSAMLTRASGRSTYELAQDWLAEPLGIAIPRWPADPQGIFFGGNDMLMSPLALARFGELYRLGGVIDGRQVVPAEWIEQSWQGRTRSPWSSEQYGYGWFSSEARGHPLHFGWGYGGQMLFIIPALDLTVVMTSDTDVQRGSSHLAELRSLLANGIVPAAEVGGTFRLSEVSGT